MPTIPTTPIHTCRFCRASSIDKPLFKYGVRHYACAKCGLELFGGPKGERFLDALPLHQVMQLPFGDVMAAGWSLGEVQAYVSKREAAGQTAPIRWTPPR
jgi:hypothetical protein